MQSENSDAHRAAAFLIERIEEHANRSGEPLDREEQFSLAHLPKSWFSSFSELVPRNFTLEKFARLAEAAHNYDLTENPEMALDWDFAAAVLKLESHPLSLLLQLAGILVDASKARSWWDGGGLIAPALLLIAAVILVKVLHLGTTVSFWCLVIAFVPFYLVTRKLERRKLKQTVETFRQRRSGIHGR